MRIIVDRREFLSLSLSVPVRDDIMYVIRYYIVLQAIYDRRHIWTQRRNKKEQHIGWWLLQLIPVKHLFIRNDDETRRERERERNAWFTQRILCRVYGCRGCFLRQTTQETTTKEIYKARLHVLKRSHSMGKIATHRAASVKSFWLEE